MTTDEKKRFFMAFVRVKKCIPVVFSDSNINFTEYIALTEIQKKEDFLNLTEDLHINKSAVSQMLSNLEQKGFINRKVNEKDRRKNDLSLTELGEKTLEKMNTKRAKITDEIFGEFTEEKSLKLLHLFEEFADVIGETSKQIKSNI